MSDYFHYYNAITNTSGDSLAGYFARVLDPATGAALSLYADDAGTPIITVSGYADLAVTDSAGNLSFYLVPGTYNVDLYAPDATTFIKRIPKVGMTSTQGVPGPSGPPGAAGNVASSLAELKAALTTNDTMIYQKRPYKWFATSDDAADDDIVVASDDTGFWISQKAADLPAADGNTVQQNLDAKTRTFEQFLPVAYDYTTDDCSAALVTAATWSAANNSAVVFSRRYLIASTPTITADGFHFDGQGAQFDLNFDESDTDSFGTISNGTTGPIGILVQGCTHPCMSGYFRFMGQGEAGTTRVAGIVFDTCTFAETGNLFFDNLAEGMMTIWCSSCNFTGSVSANGLNGAQPFSATFDDAGSARVVAECVDCNYGDTLAISNHKPVVYMSTSPAADGTKVTNTNCTFGRITGTGQSGSGNCMLLGVRSAKGCKFAGCAGTDFNAGISLTRYGTDDGYEIDGNDFGSLNVTILDTDASADTGITTVFDNDATTAGLKIGTNHIGSVIVNGPVGGGTSNNQLFGVFLANGGATLTIDSLTVNGCYYGAQVSDCSLITNKAQFAGFGGNPVRYGKGAVIAIKQSDILTGSVTTAQTGLFLYSSSAGTGGTPDIQLDVINYAQNGVGNNTNYVLFDATNSPQNVRIGHINGTGSAGQARWLSDVYSVRNGRLLRTGIPTTGSFTQGDLVWNASASANGIMGWQRLTTGSAHVSGTDWAVVRAVQQQTGWTTGTGTANKGAFAAYAGSTRSASYSQTEAQATDDAVKAASQRLLAVEQALRTAGVVN